MKKLFIVALIAVSTLSANAQSEQGTLTIQPRIGAAGSAMSNNPQGPMTTNSQIIPLNSDLDGISSGIVGAELEYQMTKKLSLSAGLNYQGSGTAWKDATLDGVLYKDIKLKTHYITVPVTANFYLFKGFAIKSGLQFGYLIDAKQSFTEMKTTGMHDNELRCKDKLNKFDLSIPVGISYEFKTPIVIDMRFNFGLTKVGKSESAFKDCRNNSLLLTVGYKFKL